MNDQPISAQNTLQRQHLSRDLRLPRSSAERLSAATTTSDNDPVYGYGGGPQYRYNGYHPRSPGAQSELSSEDKYVAMSPPHLVQYEGGAHLGQYEAGPHLGQYEGGYSTSTQQDYSTSTNNREYSTQDYSTSTNNFSTSDPSSSMQTSDMFSNDPHV